MDYKKLYEKAVERAKTLTNSGFNDFDFVKHIFPELKESEDERIKNEIINFIKDNTLTYTNRGSEIQMKWIAWLEKQGQTFTKKDVDDAYLKGVCDAKQELEKQGDDNKEYWRGYREGKQEILDKYAELEKNSEQNPNPCDGCINRNGYINCENGELREVEQKPADKVEPKFHESDWVIDKQGIVHQIANVIKNVTYNTYGYDIVGGGYFNDNTEGVRLWTIQDAKSGNVLATKAGDIFIYKELLYDKPFAYCGIDKFGVFKDCNCGDGLDWTPYLSDVTPATKEQCNILEKAMADAGYTFDFEKKELKKEEVDNLHNYLYGEQKPAWSEEDSPYYDDICEMLINLLHSETTDVNKGAVQKDLDWFISLKPQSTWKPSDEQMITLRHVISGCSYDIEPLVEIEEHLKKLREEDV